MILQSPSYGSVTMRQAIEIMHSRIGDNPHDEYSIIIGTDSQNFDKTKVVVVIAIVRPGKGGFFFYNTHKVYRIDSVRQKLHHETSLSISTMEEFMQELEAYSEETDFDYTDLHYCIHVDAGDSGKSGQYIPEIVGWITSMGYQCETKPQSFVASSIADRFSK